VFVSDRDGNYDVYIMPIDGGQPKRLTWHMAADIPSGFTVDGKNLLFSSTRTMGWNRGGANEVWMMPLTGGTPKRVTYTGGSVATTPDNGDTLYFVGGASDAKVQEYEGTANDRLYVQRGGTPPEEILSFRGNSREPSVSRDGKRLHFTREINGNFELFVCDTETQTCEQVTNLGERGMSGVSFAPDDSMVVFTWKFYLWSLDLTAKDAKPKQLKIEIREDSRGNNEMERRLDQGIERAALSNDGKRIVFSLTGDLWIMSAHGGTAMQLTGDQFQDDNPKLSPDGKTVSFYSNRGGNPDIWLIDANGQNLRQFTTNPADDFFQNWSPDGQSIAFCSTRSGNKDIWIKRVDGSASVQLTTDAGNDDDPCFSPDGRMIAFDSNRNNPEGADIWIMDANGQNQRRVYGSAAVDEVPVFSPDGRFIVFDRIIRGGNFMRQELMMTDLAGSGEVRIASGAYASFTPDGKEILFVDRQGRLNYALTPNGIQNGRTVPFVAVKKTTQKAEMLKAFDEAHSAYASSFYDPKFHGKDWAALGKQYRALVESAGCREEFLYYLNRMVGEISASHSGASQAPAAGRQETGYLGMELLPEAMGNRQRLKVMSVEKGGPADQAWIREGDYVFRVERQPLGANDTLERFLDGKAGQEVSLHVADNPEGRNFREVKVKCEAWAQRRARLYQQFVMGNKQETARQTRGQVAYVHIPAMNQQALAAFQAELVSPPVQRAKALIIDVRDNGGGNIHQQLVDLLSRKPYAYMQMRDGRKVNQPTAYWDRPIVILINERSYSDAEVFPHAMKTLDRATIVGVQTPGAVIGTNDITLSDGTRWRLPRTGFFNWDGKNQEHNGCEPDIEVRIDPADLLAGKDTQLERAMEVALEHVKGPAKSKPEGPPEPTQPTKPEKTGEFTEPAALPWE
jgi:Tol biopolymer transport system component